MMKNVVVVQIPLSREDYQLIIKSKGKYSWHEWMLLKATENKRTDVNGQKISE